LLSQAKSDNDFTRLFKFLTIDCSIRIVGKSKCISKNNLEIVFPNINISKTKPGSKLTNNDIAHQKMVILINEAQEPLILTQQ